MLRCGVFLFFFFKQKTAYERRISDGSSDVCSSDLARGPVRPGAATAAAAARRIGHLDPRADRRRRAVARAGAGGGGRLPPQPPSIPEWGRGSRAGRHTSPIKTGRAPCRESACRYRYISVVAVSLQKKQPEPKSDCAKTSSI